MFKKNSWLISILMAAFVASLFLTGCGGGGGGGGGGVTDTTGAGTTNTPTPTSSTGNAAAIPALSTSPSNYSSVAFPSRSATLPAITPTDGKVGLVVVNNSGTAATVSLNGTVGAFSAKVEDLPSIDVSEGKQSALALAEAIPLPKLHRDLRNAEKRMPSFSAAPASGKVSSKAAIRADFVGQTTTFKAYMGEGVSPKSITATCRMIKSMTGTDVKVNFYVDDALTYTSDIENLLGVLYNSWAGIYTTDRTIFGSEPPATFHSLGNDITVLLSAQIDSAGFFYSGDLYDPSQIQGGISNQRKMFYLQYNPTELTDTTLASTMAHEFQHMINFYQRNLNGVKEDDWLNEAMSGYAEHVCGFKASTNNQSKALQINKFFASIANYNLAANPWPGEHENYGQVYLFGVWLGQRYGSNGAVTSLLSGTKVGTSGIADFTGESFDTVFAKWMVSLYANDTSGKSIYGYKDLNLKATYSYGSNLRDVTLTGPTIKTVSPVGTTFSTGDFSIAPYASSYLVISATPGQTFNVTLPGGVNFFELHN